MLCGIVSAYKGKMSVMFKDFSHEIMLNMISEAVMGIDSTSSDYYLEINYSFLEIAVCGMC